MASIIADWRPIDFCSCALAKPLLSQLVIQKYKHEMPTAINTERTAKLILANLNSTSIAANDQSRLSRNHNPKLEKRLSRGAVREYAKMAVIGNTQIIVNKIANPLLATIFIIGRMS